MNKKNLTRFIVPTMLIGVAGIAPAANLTVINTSAFLDNRASDDPFLTGLNLNLEAIVSDSVGGSAALLAGSASFSSSNPGYSLSTSMSCCDTDSSQPSLAGFGATPAGVTAGNLSTLSGTYTFTVADANGTVMGDSHNLDYLVILALPTNIGFSDNSTTPTVTITDSNAAPPDGITRGYQLKIYDSLFNRVYDSGGGLAASIAVPAGILLGGQLYHIRAEILDADTAELNNDSINPIEDRSVGWTTFTPVPLPGTLPLLASALVGVGTRSRRRRG